MSAGAGTDLPAHRAFGASLGPVAGAVAARALQGGVALLGASVFVFLLGTLAPGDPAQRVLVARGVVRPAPIEVAAVRAELELDRPLPARYASWLRGALRGDFGRSWRTGRPVAGEIAARLPPTVLLAGVATLLTLGLSLPAGVVAGAFPGRWPDHALRLAAGASAAVPVFVVGLVALRVVVLDLGWGSVLPDGTAADVWLPAAVLAAGSFGLLSRVLRGAVIGALGQRYALVAAARGATRRRVVLRHALPNALVAYVHAVALSAGALLGGAVVVEVVFSWPGLGRHLVEAVRTRDLPVVQAVTLVGTFAFVATSLAADALTRALEGRS